MFNNTSTSTSIKSVKSEDITPTIKVGSHEGTCCSPIFMKNLVAGTKFCPRDMSPEFKSVWIEETELWTAHEILPRDMSLQHVPSRKPPENISWLTYVFPLETDATKHKELSNRTEYFFTRQSDNAIMFSSSSLLSYAVAPYAFFPRKTFLGTSCVGLRKFLKCSAISNWTWLNAVA